jgi:hypothetical protein
MNFFIVTGFDADVDDDIEGLLLFRNYLLFRAIRPFISFLVSLLHAESNPTTGENSDALSMLLLRQVGANWLINLPCSSSAKR